jgi:hypothetical protein
MAVCCVKLTTGKSNHDSKHEAIYLYKSTLSLYCLAGSPAILRRSNRCNPRPQRAGPFRRTCSKCEPRRAFSALGCVELGSSVSSALG